MSTEQDNENTDTESLAATVATAAEKAQKAEEAQKVDVPVAPQGWRPSRALLVAAGVGVVGLLAGGGIGFAVGHANGSSSTTGSPAALTLPGSLTGGYQRSATVDTNIKTAVESASTTLGAGTDMALYTKDKTQVLVEATRLPGAALLQAGMTYAKVGDAVCASTSSSSGTEAICSRSTGALTVKVTAGSTDLASKYVDEVFNALV